MLRDEAEREAERRNQEDPDRARYEYYAFDVSAGMADDAWDVSARLRQTAASTSDWPSPGPQTAAAGAPETEEAPLPERREQPWERPEPEPHEEPLVLGGPTIAEIDPFSGPDFSEPPPPGEVLPLEAEEDHFADDRRDKGGWFVRSIGILVLLVGIAWIGLVIFLTSVLNPNSSTSVIAFVALGLVGLVAVILGTAILRS